MKIEEHIKAFEEHKRTIFRWAVEVLGAENSQRIIGLHASRGITELLSAALHKKSLIDHGFQLNHRWFKSKKVSERLPEFLNKPLIVNKMIELETLSEELAYGTQKSPKEIEKCVNLFKELEKIIKGLIGENYEKK